MQDRSAPLTPAAFLARTLPGQDYNVMPHELPGGQRVWLKKAGPRHGRWRYWLLGGLAGLLGLEVLSPVPNPGGEAAIGQEARRLRALAALGVRVPTVLAEQPDGLLLADLGQPGQAAVNLWEAMERAAPQGAPAVLALWQLGLAAIAEAHGRGAYLSQAFARNLVRCPDGEIGFLDFEDDPGAALPPAQCQARDWLSYLHSTALLLDTSGALPGAAAAWRQTLAGASPEVVRQVQRSARRMAWLRRLPADRRWGRDLQRLGAAARLVAAAGTGQA